MSDLVKIYTALGAGGLALVALIWTFIYQTTKINPVLISLKTDTAVMKEIIKNNTRAIQEVSNSNQNVASALGLLNNSIGSFTILLEKHDIRSEKIEDKVTEIYVKTNNCAK